MKAQLVGLSILLPLLMTAPAHAGRLFATSASTQHGVIEIDPQTGEVLNVLKEMLDEPLHAPWDGLAFDGTHLWFLGADMDTIFKMDPDSGATIDSYALTPAGGFRSGLAYLNGLLYTLDWNGINQDILVFDPTVGAIVNTFDYNVLNPGGPFLYTYGLSAITEPDALLVVTGIARDPWKVIEIDPTSGLIIPTMGFEHAQSRNVEGAAAIDGEIYLSTHTSPDIYVYNRSGDHLRTITVPASQGIQSLAGDDTAQVPEPSTIYLLLSGSLLLLGRRWCRRRPR